MNESVHEAFLGSHIELGHRYWDKVAASKIVDFASGDVLIFGCRAN